MEPGTKVRVCSCERFGNMEDSVYPPNTEMWKECICKQKEWANMEMTVMGVVANKYIIVEENLLPWEYWQVERVV